MPVINVRRGTNGHKTNALSLAIVRTYTPFNIAHPTLIVIFGKGGQVVYNSYIVCYIIPYTHNILSAVLHKLQIFSVRCSFFFFVPAHKMILLIFCFRSWLHMTYSRREKFVQRYKCIPTKTHTKKNHECIQFGVIDSVAFTSVCRKKIYWRRNIFQSRIDIW